MNINHKYYNPFSPVNQPQNMKPMDQRHKVKTKLGSVSVFCLNPNCYSVVAMDQDGCPYRTYYARNIVTALDWQQKIAHEEHMRWLQWAWKYGEAMS